MKTKLTPGMVVRCDDNCVYQIKDIRGNFASVVILGTLHHIKPGHNTVGFAGVNWLQKGQLIAKNFKLNF